jgi:hypothetical protein
MQRILLGSLSEVISARSGFREGKGSLKNEELQQYTPGYQPKGE